MRSRSDSLDAVTAAADALIASGSEAVSANKSKIQLLTEEIKQLLSPKDAQHTSTEEIDLLGNTAERINEAQKKSEATEETVFLAILSVPNIRSKFWEIGLSPKSYPTLCELIQSAQNPAEFFLDPLIDARKIIAGKVSNSGFMGTTGGFQHPATQDLWSKYLIRLETHLKDKINLACQEENLPLLTMATKSAVYALDQAQGFKSDADFYLQALKLAQTLLENEGEKKYKKEIKECKRLYTLENEKINKTEEAKLTREKKNRTAEGLNEPAPESSLTAMQVALKHYRKILSLCPQNKTVETHFNFFSCLENSRALELLLLQHHYNQLFADDADSLKKVTSVIDEAEKKIDDLKTQANLKIISDLMRLHKELKQIFPDKPDLAEKISSKIKAAIKDKEIKAIDLTIDVLEKIKHKHPIVVCALARCNEQDFPTLSQMKGMNGFYKIYQSDADFALHPLNLAIAIAKGKIQNEFIRESFISELKLQGECLKTTFGNQFDSLSKEAFALRRDVKALAETMDDSNFYLYKLQNTISRISKSPDVMFENPEARARLVYSLNSYQSALKIKIKEELRKHDCNNNTLEKYKKSADQLVEIFDICSASLSIEGLQNKNEIPKLVHALMQLLFNQHEALLKITQEIQDTLKVSPNTSADELLRKIAETHPQVVYSLAENLRKNPDGEEHQYLRTLLQKPFEGIFEFKTAADFYLYPLILAQAKFSAPREAIFSDVGDQENRIAKLLALREKLNQKIKTELAKGDNADISQIQEAHRSALKELEKAKTILSQETDYLLKPVALALELLEKLPQESDSTRRLIGESQALQKLNQDSSTPKKRADIQEAALKQFRDVLLYCTLEGGLKYEDKIREAYQKLLDDDLFYFRENSQSLSKINLQFKLIKFFADNKTADDSIALFNISKLFNSEVEIDGAGADTLDKVSKLIDLELKLTATFSYDPDLLTKIREKIKLLTRSKDVARTNIDKLVEEIARDLCLKNIVIARRHAKDQNLPDPDDFFKGLNKLHDELTEIIKTELLKNPPHEPNQETIRKAINEPTECCQLILHYQNPADFYLHPLNLAILTLEKQTHKECVKPIQAKRDDLKAKITTALGSEEGPEKGQKLQDAKTSAATYLEVAKIFNENLSVPDTNPEGAEAVVEAAPGVAEAVPEPGAAAAALPAPKVYSRKEHKEEIDRLQEKLARLLENDPSLLKDVSDLIKKQLASDSKLREGDLIKILASHFPVIIVMLGEDLSKGFHNEHAFLIGLVKSHVIKGDPGLTANAYYLYPLKLAQKNIQTAEAGVFKNAAAQKVLVDKFKELQKQVGAEVQAELKKGEKAKPAKLAGAKNIALEHFKMSQVICKKEETPENKKAAILNCYDNTSRDPLWKTVLKILGIVAITAACAVAGFVIGSIISHGVLGVPGAVKGAFLGAAWGTAMITGTAVGAATGLCSSSALFYVPRGVTKTTDETKKSALEAIDQRKESKPVVEALPPEETVVEALAK